LISVDIPQFKCEKHQNTQHSFFHDKKTRPPIPPAMTPPKIPPLVTQTTTHCWPTDISGWTPVPTKTKPYTASTTNPTSTGPKGFYDELNMTYKEDDIEYLGVRYQQRRAQK
jgi:hypothetical protein